MYKNALEVLRTGSRKDGADWISAKDAAAAFRDMPRVLSGVGSASAVALGLALDNTEIADDLRDLADDVVSYMDGVEIISSNDCPSGCVINEIDDGKVVDSRCGTKDECDAGIWFAILLLVIAIVSILKWIFDW